MRAPRRKNSIDGCSWVHAESVSVDYLMACPEDFKLAELGSTTVWDNALQKIPSISSWFVSLLESWWIQMGRTLHSLQNETGVSSEAFTSGRVRCSESQTCHLRAPYSHGIWGTGVEHEGLSPPGPVLLCPIPSELIEMVTVSWCLQCETMHVVLEVQTWPRGSIILGAFPVPSRV